MSKNHDELKRVFKSWLNRHGLILEKVACLHSFSKTERADLSQEMLVQLWRSISGYKQQCKETTWIYRICLNTALTWKRDTGRRSKWAKKNEAETQQQETHNAQGSGATEDLIEALYGAIRKLSVLDRNIIQLSLDGLTYTEMAEITGLKESNIGSRLTRARQQLATLIEED